MVNNSEDHRYLNSNNKIEIKITCKIIKKCIQVEVVIRYPNNMKCNFLKVVILIQTTNLLYKIITFQ